MDNDLPQSAETKLTGRARFEVAQPRARLGNWNVVLTLVFSFLLVGITGLYTIYSRRQWRAMESTLQETQISREVENRAYLNVKFPKLEKLLTVGEQPRAQVIFANTGQTPARHTVVSAFIESREASAPEPDPEALTPAKGAHSRGVVARDTEVLTNLSSPTVLNEQIIADVNSGRIKLYVWGLVEYDDVFGKKFRTGFCGSLAPGGISFDMCARGNFAE